MAAEALTAKRRAAFRVVLPPSTTRTIRSRRSWDKGGPPPLVWRGEIRISGCLAQGDRLHAGASLGRGSVSQGRVQALPIVKYLDVLEHRRPRLGARAELGLMDLLCFE